MGSGSTREKTQQIAYQRDFLGSCWNSPYGQQEAEQFLPSRWMGLSKSVMQLHTGNQCFVLRTVRFDDDAADQQQQNSRVVEEARATVAAATGGGGENGSFTSPSLTPTGALQSHFPARSNGSLKGGPAAASSAVPDDSSFASVGGGSRLRRQLQVQQPAPTLAPHTTAGESKSKGGRSGVGMPSPHGSARDLAALGAAPAGKAAEAEAAAHGASERARRDMVQTKTKTLTGRRKAGDTVLVNAVRDTAEQDRVVHNHHPYLKAHGLSVFPGVMFRAAPARRRYDRISFVAPPVEVVQNYLRHVYGDNGEDDDDDDSSAPLPPRPQCSSALSTATPSANPTPMLRSAHMGQTGEAGSLGGSLMMAASAPSYLPRLLPETAAVAAADSASNPPTPFRRAMRSPLSPNLLPPRLSFTLDPATTVAAQLQRHSPLNPMNNYPIEDADIPTVNALTPPIIVGSITAAELQALPTNAEICLGGWLYVSLQDEQRRLRKALAAYEEKLRRRTAERPAPQRGGSVPSPVSSSSTAVGLGRGKSEPAGSTRPRASISSAASGTDSPSQRSSAATRQPSLVELGASVVKEAPPAHAESKADAASAAVATATEVAANEDRAALPHSDEALQPKEKETAPTPTKRMAVSCNVPLEELLKGDLEPTTTTPQPLPVKGEERATGRQLEDEADDPPQQPPRLVRHLSDPTFLRGAAATKAAAAASPRGRSRTLAGNSYRRYFATSPYPNATTHFTAADTVGMEGTWLPYAYLFIALPMYECSMHPSTFHMAMQRPRPVSLNMENPQSRRAFGVGCVSSVRYGGVTIIECRDRVCPGDEDWVLQLIALGKERAKMDAAAAQGRGKAGGDRKGDGDKDADGGTREPCDDALPFSSSWTLLIDPSQLSHTLQQQQRAEHLQAVKRRIRRRLKRLGLYVVSASTRAATRHRRAARRSVQAEVAGGLSVSGRDDAAAASDDEADKNRDGNSDDQDEDRDIRGEMDRARRRGQRRHHHHHHRGQHKSDGDGNRSGYLPSSESDSDQDGDGAADAASDWSGNSANHKASNERAFRRQRPQRIIRGTFRQLGGMRYLDAGALMEGCPVSEVVRAVEQWIRNLLLVPVKARPLSLFLQRYEGIAPALRLAGAHAINGATDTAGGVLLNNMSFNGAGTTSPAGGTASFSAALSASGGGSMLLPAARGPASPLTRAPPGASAGSAFPSADPGGVYSPASVTHHSFGRGVYNGSMDSQQGGHPSSFSPGNGSFGNAASAGGLNGSPVGGGGMRLTLPYVTWYTGPLDPVVTAVLPPALAALIKKELEYTPTTDSPLAFPCASHVAVTGSTVHSVPTLKVGGNGGGGNANRMLTTGPSSHALDLVAKPVAVEPRHARNTGAVAASSGTAASLPRSPTAGLSHESGRPIPDQVSAQAATATGGSTPSSTPPPQPTLPLSSAGPSALLGGAGGGATVLLSTHHDQDDAVGSTIETILMRHGASSADLEGDNVSEAAPVTLRGGGVGGGTRAMPAGPASAVSPSGMPPSLPFPRPPQPAALGNGSAATVQGKVHDSVGGGQETATAAATVEHADPLSAEDEEAAWQAADKELRRVKGELDEMQFLVANAKTELQERLEEFITVGSLFLPHTRSDQVELNVLFLKMLRHYPEEVPIKELRADWMPTMLALLTTPHEAMFAKTSTGAMSPHLANASAAGDMCDANRPGGGEGKKGNSSSGGGGGDDGQATKYSIESFLPIPQILRTAHGLPPLARLREVAIAPLPYRVNPETARALERMGMDSGLSFVFTGGSLGVLAGVLTYYTDYVKHAFQDQLGRLRSGTPAVGADGATAPQDRVVAAAAAAARSAMELLEQTHTVLLQRVVVWGATTGRKGVKSLEQWQEMHDAYCHMLDPTAKAAASPTVNSPGYYVRKFAAAATGRGEDQEIAAAAATLLSASSANPASASSSRARLIAKEMDLHAERVGIPFRAAECFALFDAIAYYLSTLEALERQFHGAAQPQKPRKRRSLLKPFLKKGAPASEAVNNNADGSGRGGGLKKNRSARGDPAEGLTQSTMGTNVEDDVAGTGGGGAGPTGSQQLPEHPMLREPFELVIATNYYYKHFTDERQQPQIVPDSLLPAPPPPPPTEQARSIRWAPRSLESALGGSRATTATVTKGIDSGYHFPPANGEHSGFYEASSRTLNLTNPDGILSLNDINVDPASVSGFDSGGGGGADPMALSTSAANGPMDSPVASRSRGPSSVPPSPCIMPLQESRTTVGRHNHGNKTSPPRSPLVKPLKPHPSHDDLVGWRRLVGLGSHTHSAGGPRKDRSGGGGKHHAGKRLVSLGHRKAGKSLVAGGASGGGGGGAGTDEPKHNGRIPGCCEEPYCGGEELPEADIYAKLQKDSKKLFRFLEECLERWKRQSEGGGGAGAAAYAKRIRISYV